jgi:uncharacterized protein YabE (DUF348 family)
MDAGRGPGVPSIACTPVAVPGETEVWSIVLAFLSGTRGRIAAQAAVLTAVVGGGVAYSAINKTITLSVDGRTTEVHAFARTVEGLLDDQDLDVGSRDIVAPAPGTALDDGDTVVVRYARPLTLTVDGVKRTHWTTELSVDKALSAMGVRLDGAQLSASRSARIERTGMSLWLSTPKRVVLAADGKNRAVVSSAPTVAELLKEQSVNVGPLDKLSAVPSTPIAQGMTIRLIRIETKRVTAKESVAFPVRRTETSKLFKGETKVVTEGKKGSRTAVYDVVMADGKMSSKKLVSATVTAKPVTQVVQVGTKSRPSSGGDSGGSSGGSSGGNVGGSVDSLNWAALAECESGGNPKAVNPAGPYMGLYQFSQSTWESVGGSGKPSSASSSEQTYRAKLLYKKAGAGQWPNCGSRLFS